MFSFLLGEIADIVDGQIIGNRDLEITGVAGIKDSGKGKITFLANPKYESFLSVTKASAIIASTDVRDKFSGAIIKTENPYLAFFKVVKLFDKPHMEKYKRGIDKSILVHDSVKLGEDIHVGMNVHIGEGARIGNRTTVLPFVYIGEDVEIGDDCLIYPNVSIREGCSLGDRVIIHSGAVIGSDGFGYAQEGKVHKKISQIGVVVIENDVEIGANSTVDRATMGKTIIKQGTKIDNLVQVAHNVVIGENSIVAAQAGISGSTELGQGVVLAGQSGLVGHIKIGDNAKVGAQGGVTKSVPANTIVSGYPARKHIEACKIYAATAHLPNLFKEFKDLKAKVEKLEKGHESGSSAKND
ncbi:MAG: UDP-3-O-(3-hydroxymyristoyl)glucosamine N-acyltransferase [Bacteroidales bacterium]|nr:UDP-3-O-(3-hydroxymyristoyl)glucosamine N-acyltransferase [Bacteroidales bacterium]